MVLPNIREEPAGEAFPLETLAAIQQLNVDPCNARFMLLVDDLLRPESLPRGWTAEFKPADNKWEYTEKAGRKHDKHPVYDYYIGAMFMDLGGYAQLKAIAAARPPSAEEVQQMCQYFGIKPDEEKYIQEVAEMGLCAPLPPGWKEHVQEHEQEPGIAFRNEATGEVQQEHPLDNYFRELIRRRRRELLRRKKAALKSLQALIKMGMGRRGVLAAVKPGASNTTSTDEQQDDPDTDVDGFSPETQAALQTAWQGLLGTAGQLVHSMQAAAWDGTTGLVHDAASAAAAAPAANDASGGPGSASSQRCEEQGGTEASRMRHRLQQLAAVLSEAAGPSGVDPVKAAGAALADIQRLAALATAAGSNADALAAVLAGQGISLPDYASSSIGAGSDDGSETGVWQSSVSRPSGAVGGSSQQVSGTGASASAGSVNSSTGPEAGTARHSSLEGRATSSLQTADSGDTGSLQRRPSLLRDAVPFVGAIGATASTAGSTSTSGAGNKPWSLAGGKPDAAAQATAAAVRGTAAARAVKWDEGVPAAGAEGAAAASRFSFGQAFDAATAAAAGVFKKKKRKTGEAAPPAAADGVTDAAQADSSGPAVAGSSASTSSSAQPASQPAGVAEQGPCKLLSLLHGTNFPPAAEAAVQHLAALQAVTQQALGLMKSWQQQRVIIALLQQRLQEAVHRASMSQHRLATVRRELQQIQADRESGVADAAAVTQQCSHAAEQLQQAQQELAAAVEAKQSLQQRLDAALAELADAKGAVQKLQAESGSDAQAAAAEAAALAAAHKQLQDSTHTLQEELQAAQAAVAAGQESCEQLGQQLAAVTAQLQQEQAEKQEVLPQLQQAKEAYAALQAQHQQLLSNAGSEAAAASAELAQLKASMQQLQDAHGALQQEHAAALASASSSQEHQQQLQQQLSQARQQLSELQVAHAALQAAHATQGQQLQDAQQALTALQAAHAQQDAELSTAQRQLSSLQDSHATALQQQESLQAHLSSTQSELAAMQAAAAAAAKTRAGMPHKHTQVAATDHADAHWVASRGVQTCAELDPKSTKDAGTPADLSLLSYFFREIKQKQRGGGGAILGYDPAEAAAVGQWQGPPSQSAKSWSGGTGLPPISSSSPGARDSKSAAARSASPTPQKRPATMPGTLRPSSKAADNEEEDGGFSTRPPSWEVRQKVDRRRDRAIKLAGGTSADGDKWDYAIEERDAEITELKRRLVDSEHRAREAASKAAEELRVMGADLQSCKRSLEQVQAEYVSLSKDLTTLKLALQAATGAAGEEASAVRVSRFSAVGLPGLKAGGARLSSAPSAYTDAGVAGLGAGAVLRSSVAVLSGSGGGGGGGQGLLASLGGSRVSAAYGTGRLTALPSQFPGGSPAGGVGASSSLSPYAAAGGAARKSVVAPPLPEP